VILDDWYTSFLRTTRLLAQPFAAPSLSISIPVAVRPCSLEFKMAPSGYIQVNPTKSRKGIARPGAVHLTLPLVDRHSCAYDSGSDEENLLTPASSYYTISAAPKSSASLYSQASYGLSPPAFSENRLDRRRFGIAMTPAQEGPWTRHVELQSPDANVFMLDLQSATVDTNPFVGSDEETEQHGLDIKEIGAVQEVKVREKKVLKVYAPSETILSTKPKGKEISPEATADDVVSKETTKANMKKFRMSSRVIGKMFSRLSAHQSSSRPIDTEELPLLPALPPQIQISLPSPGLKFPSSPQDDQGTKNDLRAFVLEKNVPGKRSTLPSAWKPHRPPSPLPKALRKLGKHKGNSSSLAHLVVVSPPPPLPTRAHLVAHPVLADSPKAAYQRFSTPLHSAMDVASPGQDSSRWEDVRMRLRARALKSDNYAVHDGGIISPTSSRL